MALAGFGLDSLIEIVASVVVIWQLRGIHAHRERTALRLIAIAFSVFVMYILGQLLVTVLTHTPPHPSSGGTLWLALTLGVMLGLA